MSEVEQLTFEFAQRPTIKGFPELRWTGKRPYKSTQYYPAQLRETYGEEQNGWMNKIFWGDNLQVMSHLLKEYRGQIDLIYIDPPFDSKIDYKRKIEIRNIGKAETDSSSFEEKQYGDIWTNDEYLQFMYERLLLMRELLSDTGSIFLHCDWHKSHHLRCLMDEVFGVSNFVNEIAWCYYGPGSPGMRHTMFGNLMPMQLESPMMKKQQETSNKVCVAQVLLLGIIVWLTGKFQKIGGRWRLQDAIPMMELSVSGIQQKNLLSC